MGLSPDSVFSPARGQRKELYTLSSPLIVPMVGGRVVDRNYGPVTGWKYASTSSSDNSFSRRHGQVSSKGRDYTPSLEDMLQMEESFLANRDKEKKGKGKGKKSG